MYFFFAFETFIAVTTFFLLVHNLIKYFVP